MARNRKLQNRIGLVHITDEAEASIIAEATISSEQIEDIVGAMLDGTETFIDVAYDDTNGNLDFVVAVKDEDNMASNSDTYLATQQSIKTYVDAEVAGVVDSSPAALNTLNELAAALGDDANYAATTATLLGNRLRVDTAAQGLSSTQQSNALLNMGLTASKAELNILAGGLSAGEIPNLATSKITSGTFPTARIADDAITAGKLSVSGNGSATQFLRSDGDGTFSWVVPTDTNTQLSQEQVEDYVSGLLTNGSNITLTYNDSAGTLTVASQDTTYTSSDFTHDNLTGVSANKHIDWTASGVGTIHASNYLNTTYSVGDGGLTQINFTTADNTKLDGIAASANNYVLPLKDEDNMASNSATHVASQQSIKTYVDTEVAGLVSSAPAALDTLNELAAALGDDANYATTTATSIGTKLTKSDNLSDLTNAGTARTNLGLGTAATLGGTGSVANNNAGLVTGDTVYDYIQAQGFATGSGDEWGTAVDAHIIPDTDNTYDLGSATVEFRNAYFDGQITTDGIRVSGTSYNTLLSSANGSAGYPTYTFEIDENTGMYRAGADTLGFSTAGTSRLSIAADGTVSVAGGFTATNATLTTPNLGTPSAIVLTNATGTASNLTAGSATNVVTAAENSSGDWFKIPFVASATGSQQLKTDAGFSFRPSTNKLSVSGDFSTTGSIILEDGSGYIKLGGSNSNALRFYDDDSSHYATIKQPSTIATNYTLTLPTTAGSANQFLQTNGSGVLSWGSASQLSLLDEDDMSSNSATAAASQQSVKAYVDTEVAGIVDSAPTALNTLNELAAALGDDANYAATTTTSIGLKLAKASNLSDLANAGIARNNLGLDTAATKGVAPNNASGVANGQGSLVTGNAVYQYVTDNGGDSWGTVVDANIVPDNNNSRTLGSPSKKFGSVYFAGTSYNTLLSSADGSAPYPTYTFEYDENTGMYRGGTDILGFSTAGTSRITIAADGAVNFVASKIKLNNSYGSDGQVLTSTGSGVAWENAASGGIASVVADTTPQLGGNLDTQSHSIQSSGNYTDIKPGAGSGNHSVRIGDVATNPGILRVGSNAESNTLPLAVTVQNSSNTQNRTAVSIICALPSGTRAAGFGPILELRSSSGVNYTGQVSGRILTKQIGTGESANHDLIIEAMGTGAVRINDEFSLPAEDGSANQVMQTNGSGVLSWATISGGASAITGLSDATTSATSVWLGSTPSNATDYNASLGVGALDTLNGTSGTKNVAVGYNAGTANTEGFKNVFIGYAAGAANTNADNNVFIGSQAGTANTTGGTNTGVGTNALSQVTTVTGNTALGYYAGKGIQNGGNNVAIGSEALATNNSATQNTAVGALSQKSNSGGNSNTSLGYRTLYALTSGLRNIAIGTQALDSTTTESDNIAIGFEALYNPNGAQQNVVIGNYAADGLTSGSGNVILGHYAGSRLTTSGNNIVIGKNALDWATTGWGHNIAIGSDAMGQSATTGGRNIAIGSFALKSNTSDYGSVAVGYGALQDSTGHYNTALGDQAGKVVSSGSSNTILGWNAGDTLTSGSANIFIGKDAGDSITTGSNNVVIGLNDPPSATASGQLSISSGNGGAVWITGDNAGVVNFPHSKIQLNGSYGSDGQVLTSTGSGTAWEDVAGGGASALNALTDVTSNITNFTDSLLISPDGAAGPTGTLSNASDNIGIGKDVFKDLTSGVNSVVVGNLAGENLTTGGHEVLVGFQAGSELTATQFNTLVGYRAGKNTKGAYNIALGATALQGHGSTWHTGDWNVAIGHAALAEVQGDSDGNIAIGRSALTTLTTGDWNVVLGYEAGREMTTGGYNVLIGREAGQKITTATGNTHIGDNAGRFNTGAGNTFVGMNAGKRGTEGSTSNNTFVGNSVGSNNTGGDNTAMGHQALIFGQNGTKNVALGYYAGQRLTSTGAVVIGAEAGMNLTSGGTTVAIGYQALKTATTPQQQVAIGNQAGSDITTGNFNTLVGNYAGRKITTGFQNVAVGFNTMNAASSTAMTGSSNTAVGGNVMEDITSGGDNVGVGYNALREITTGSRNVAIGGAALDAITTINDNTAVGYAALGSGTMTGNENTAIGTYAGDALTSGNKNVLVGNQAGSSLTTGNHNTFIGYKAGKLTTTATEAIGIGDYALERNTTGGGNVAIGHQTLKYATTGLRNVAIGLDAGMSVTDGDRNTALGNDALRAVTTGSYNIGIGYVSGDNITTGSGNVVIGRADVPSATANDQLSISSGQSSTPVWLTGNSSGVVDFPNGITSGGAAVGGAAYPHEIKTAGVNWYGSQQADIRLTSLPPYGVKAMTTFTFSTSSDYDKTIFFPFVAPKTGNLSRMNTYVSSGASGLNMLVGVYSDHNGYPATLLFKGTMDWSSGGNKQITSFTDASGNSTTPSLTKNTQYHVGWVRDDSGVAYTAYVSNGQYGSSSGLNLNMAEAYVGVSDTIGQYGGSSNVLATSYNSGSPDWDDFTYFNASVKPINFGIKYA